MIEGSAEWYQEIEELIEADKIIAEEEHLRAQGFREGSEEWGDHMRRFEMSLQANLGGSYF